MPTPTVETKNSTQRGTMIRVDPEVIPALERWVEELNTGNEGVAWTRAELVRRVIGHALATRDPALLKPVKSSKD